MQVNQRKTPVQRRSAATVEFVLDAAARILDEDGLAGLNTNAVARRAGISVGSLYQYFPGKEAIVSALILKAHQRIVDGLQHLLDTTTTVSPDAAIDVMLNMVLGLQSGSAKVNRILEAEEERLPKTPAIIAAETRIDALNCEFFGRYIDPTRCSAETLQTAATDTISIVRALLDSAEQRGALDAPDLPERVARTVKAYLAPLLRAPETLRCVA